MVEPYESPSDGPGEDREDQDIQDGKFFAAIGYFSFLCFVPIFLKRDSRFAAFHGRQALILFILEAAAGIVSVVPILGALVSSLAFLAFGLISLIAIYQVLTGQYWRIPYIHDLAEKIKL